MSNSKPSICIVAHKAYGAFCGGFTGHIGGIEWQTSMLAKWLAKQGHAVSFLTWDEGGEAIEMKEGVRIIKIARPGAGLKGLRFIHPKWTGLNRAMRLANSDVYYQNGSEVVTGQVAMWCRRNRRKFVFSSASDGDFDARLQGLSSSWERGLYRYGLRHADLIIAQTETQRKLLKRNFGLESELIPMPCTHTVADEIDPPPVEPAKRMLWIGRIYQVKRPDRLVELARACPDITFDLVGPAYSDDYTRAVMEQARQTKNILIHGEVRREGVKKFYQNTSALCCTSDYEGFPNTFLEAWSQGVPVLTTFDPDSVVRMHKLGVTVNNTNEMIEAANVFFDPPRYQEMCRNAHRYVYENHRAEAVLPKFQAAFANVLATMTGKPRVMADVEAMVN